METTIADYLADASLPCPAPLDSAIEARLFGVRADGTFRPSSEEVASITRQHALGMLDLLCESQRLERCLKLDVHPVSGRPLRRRYAEDRRSEMRRETPMLKLYFYGRREAYGTAFGWDAALALGKCLESLLEDVLLAASQEATQQRLF